MLRGFHERFNPPECWPGLSSTTGDRWILHNSSNVGISSRGWTTSLSFSRSWCAAPDCVRFVPVPCHRARTCTTFFTKFPVP